MSDTIGSVLQNRHVGKSVPSTNATRRNRVDVQAAKSATDVIKANEDKNSPTLGFQLTLNRFYLGSTS